MFHFCIAKTTLLFGIENKNHAVEFCFLCKCKCMIFVQDVLIIPYSLSRSIKGFISLA